MKTLILFSTLVAITLASCEKNGKFCANGNSNMITQQREVGSFDGIDLRIHADVLIEQSATHSVSITASENLMDVIETEVHGSTLCIGSKKDRCFNGNTNIDIHVTLPDLQKIAISGSGNVVGKNNISTNSLVAEISGSGNITIDSLQVTDYSIGISGSGNVKLSGSQAAAKQTIHISGSGNVNTFAIATDETEVHISGSGKAEVNCISRLDAEISGSGDVIYKGTPLITCSSSGSGTVKPY